MTVLYIAGPMYGLPEKNYPAFEAGKSLLLAHGFTVISPLEADKFVAKNDPEPSRAWWRRTTLRLMLNAEALALLNGWQDSQGAILEVHVARALDMETRPLVDWLMPPVPVEPLP